MILCEGGLVTGEHLPISLTGAPKIRPAGVPAGSADAAPPPAETPTTPSFSIPPEGVNLEAIERDRGKA